MKYSSLRGIFDWFVFRFKNLKISWVVRAWYPRDKNRCLLTILFPFRITLILLLEQWNTWDISNEQCDEDWREDSGPAPSATAGNQPNTPPKDRLSKIVRMARKPPKTPLDKLWLTLCLVVDVHLQLVVTDDLKKESEKPYRNTQVVKKSEKNVCGKNARKQGGPVDNQAECSLQHENVKKSFDIVHS